MFSACCPKFSWVSKWYFILEDLSESHFLHMLVYYQLDCDVWGAHSDQREHMFLPDTHIQGPMGIFKKSYAL
jgi:hypothetical protein